MSNLKVKLKRNPNYCRYPSTCGWFTLLTGFTLHRWKTKQVPDEHTHQVATCPVFVDICFVMMTLDLMLSWWSFILRVMSGTLLMRNKSWMPQQSAHQAKADGWKNLWSQTWTARTAKTSLPWQKTKDPAEPPQPTPPLTGRADSVGNQAPKGQCLSYIWNKNVTGNIQHNKYIRFFPEVTITQMNMK